MTDAAHARPCACSWDVHGYVTDLCGAHNEVARRVRESEREDCAKVADAWAKECKTGGCRIVAQGIAAEIRHRNHLKGAKS
jgi:hypothetical protein